MVLFSKENSLTINRITGDSPPIYNVKATLVPCTGTDYVFLFGGFDEFDNLDSNVYLFNIKAGTWEVDDKHVGLYREGHLAVYIGDGNILVFGGIPHDEFPVEDVYVNNGNNVDSSTSTNGSVKDSLMIVYNIFSRQWVGPPSFVLNNAPSSRSRHGCCLSCDGTKVYISGGLVNSTPLNDLYCYDLVGGQWTGPIEFISRFDHFITEQNGKLYSFGGLNKDMNHVNHTLTWFDLKDHSIGELVILRRPTKRGDNNDFEDEDMEPKRSFNSADCEHIYIDSMINPTVKLDVSVPLWGSTTNDNMIYSISSFNIAELRYTPLINLSTRVHLDDTKLFYWKHSFVTRDGQLYLLGHPFNEGGNSQLERISGTTPIVPLTSGSAILEYDTQDSNATVSTLDDDLTITNPTDSSRLSYFLAIHLSDLGVPGTNSSDFTPPSSYSGSLSFDLLKFLVNGQFTDFEIITLADDNTKDDYNNNPDSYHDLVDKIINQQTDNALGHEQSFKSIKVHKSILIARWPHFERLSDSGMSETVSNKMFIPEPHLWVQGMVCYLYSDSINFENKGLFSNSIISIYDYSGMLLLSNVYELPQMRSLILQKLYHLVDVLSHMTPRRNVNGNSFSETMIGQILKVWENVLLSNEPAFLLSISSFIRDRWSTFLNSKAFQELSKDLIIKLCQECTGCNSISSTRSLKGNLNMVYARAGLNTPEPEVIRNLNASPETPSGRTRLSHSNSPFLRHLNGNSPNPNPLEPRVIRAASFPILRGGYMTP